MAEQLANLRAAGWQNFIAPQFTAAMFGIGFFIGKTFRVFRGDYFYV